MTEHFHEITKEELLQEKFDNDLILMNRGKNKRLSLPSFGTVTLKIHEKEVVNVLYEESLKLK